MGRLVVIEGLDGSGKATQTALLVQALKAQDMPVRQVSFPDYESKSSALVQMYLSGEFGAAAEEVNAYAASSFYAVDRFASFHTKWKADYDSGRLIVADRYATSNIIYQLSKLPRVEWDHYLAWMEDFEYQKLGIPRPNQVIYLDMPVDVSQKLLTKRYDGDDGKKDIHEKNLHFLRVCRDSALYAAEKLHWTVIFCAEGQEPRTKEEIHTDVLRALDSVL